MCIQQYYPKIFIKMLDNSFSWISGNWQNWQKIAWHCHCCFNMMFLSISYFILQISHAKTFKMRYMYKMLVQDVFPKIFIKMLECSFSWISGNWLKLGKTGESMKSYFPASLWITLDRIIILTPSIHHFKGLGMRNLQYEIRICQKIHNKVRMSIWSC